VRNLRDALSIFRTERFDLIHCHGYRADLLSLVASTCFRLPVVATVHGFTPNDRYLRLYRKLDLFALRHFKRVMAVSAQMEQDLVAAGLDPARVQFITNAVATPSGAGLQAARREIRARLGIPETGFVFGFVGRLSEEKGLQHLLRAFQTLSGADGHAHVVLVGDGPEQPALEQTAREMGLTDRITFAGFQSDTSRWYAAMDAFVLPSLTEGTPLALLEAMAHGVPVVATAVGGVPAIVEDQKNGLLVPPADPAALSEAMRAVARDRQLRQRLSAAGARLVQEQFNIERWTRKVEDLYMAAIAAGAKR
jgi:glycosyltransferase involved in cell wall biosynthesis